MWPEGLLWFDVVCPQGRVAGGLVVNGGTFKRGSPVGEVTEGVVLLLGLSLPVSLRGAVVALPEQSCHVTVL